VGAAAPLSGFGCPGSVPRVSTIWTPSGERPVGRPGGEEAQASRSAAGPGPTSGATDEEVAARLRELTEELLRTPAAVVVANHAMGLYELAALHLAQRPPNLAEARLAIDAFGALVEGLPGRLGESEPALKEFLARIRLAFVQATSAPGPGREGTDATPGSPGQPGPPS
jgi:hypothetical protein